MNPFEEHVNTLPSADANEVFRCLIYALFHLRKTGQLTSEQADAVICEHERQMALRTSTSGGEL